MKKVLSVCLIIVILIGMLFILTGCTNDNNKNNTASKNTSKTNTTVKNTSKNTSATNTTQKESEVDNVDFKANAEKQMAMPENGEEIAIMHVKGFGDIKFKFFKDVAPKAVENFLTHAKNGYYNGVTFHRVIDEFMIQGGDPEGTGMGGESIWGKGFGTELDYSLVPYRGSLCMAMSSLPNSIGSQFFITQAHYSESTGEEKKNGGYPEGLIEQYKEYGGALHLYMQYTVFGQVYEGMDVVDKIAKVKTETSPQADKPVEDVVIESIDVTTYSK